VSPIDIDIAATVETAPSAVLVGIAILIVADGVMTVDIDMSIGGASLYKNCSSEERVVEPYDSYWFQCGGLPAGLLIDASNKGIIEKMGRLNMGEIITLSSVLETNILKNAQTHAAQPKRSSGSTLISGLS
jgi:hypothetical protein